MVNRFYFIGIAFFVSSFSALADPGHLGSISPRESALPKCDLASELRQHSFHPTLSLDGDIHDDATSIEGRRLLQNQALTGEVVVGGEGAFSSTPQDIKDSKQIRDWREMRGTDMSRDRFFGVDDKYGHGLAALTSALLLAKSAREDGKELSDDFFSTLKGIFYYAAGDAPRNPFLIEAWNQYAKSNHDSRVEGTSDALSGIDNTFAVKSLWPKLFDINMAFRNRSAGFEEVLKGWLLAYVDLAYSDKYQTKILPPNDLRATALQFAEKKNSDARAEWVKLAIDFRDPRIGRNVEDIYCVALSEGQKVVHVTVGADHVPGVTKYFEEKFGASIPIDGRLLAEKMPALLAAHEQRYGKKPSEVNPEQKFDDQAIHLEKDFDGNPIGLTRQAYGLRIVFPFFDNDRYKLKRGQPEYYLSTVGPQIKGPQLSSLAKEFHDEIADWLKKNPLKHNP